MPPKLSKFFIDATCKEYAHPWTDSCVSTTAGLGLHCLQESLRIYTTVYVFTLLMRGKVPSTTDVQRTILGILQSTAFLSWSGFSYSMFICGLRRVLGNFNFLTVSFLPSFLSSFTSILIERPSRRTLLCLYVSNIATETLFKMGQWRGYYSPVPRGETYIFAVSVTLLLYFFRSKMNNKDSIYKIIRFLIGPYEQAEYLKTHSDVSTSSGNSLSRSENEEARRKVSEKSRMQKRKLNILLKSFEVYKRIIDRLKAQGKHETCPHPHSCAHYVLSGGVRLFGLGLTAQIALKLVFQMKKLFSKPQLLKTAVFKRDNVNLGLFLGGFAGLYRLISCLLRRSFKEDSSYYAIPAGLMSSVAFMAYPNNTIALYFMWKALQLLWNDFVDRGIVPEVKWFVIFLYCFSTAVLFHTAIIEPQNLRSSYWKFLYNISGGRIATMSRIPLEQFGLGSLHHLEAVLRKTNTVNTQTYSF